MSEPPKPTDDDVLHLRDAMKDVRDGWCLHPFTCAKFRTLGWLDANGWTTTAYAASRPVSAGTPPETPEG